MSELKEVYAYQSDEIESLVGNANGNSYYLKSEADTVIAEKDKEIRRQKYLRCLDFAQWCSYKSECFDKYSRLTDYIPNIAKYRRKRDHYADRCNKLVLLAEKFKEAK